MKLVINLDDPADIERGKSALELLSPNAAGGRAAGGVATPPAAPASPTTAPPTAPPAPPAAPAASAPPPPPAAPTSQASAPPAAPAPTPPAAASPSSAAPPPPPPAPGGADVAKLNTAMQGYAKVYKAAATKARFTEMATAAGHTEWTAAAHVPADMLDWAVTWFATA